MNCPGFGLETYRWPNQVTVGKIMKVHCKECHGAIPSKVKKYANGVVTVDIPKHKRAVPWHKRG